MKKPLRNALWLRRTVLHFLPLLLCLPMQTIGESVRQNPRGVAAWPLERRLRWLLLPKVEFRGANLAGALEYLKRQAAKQSGGAIDMPYVLAVPDEVAFSHTLTLSLNDVPFLEALRYVGELAKVKLAIENDKLVAKPDDGRLSTLFLPRKDASEASPGHVLKKGLDGSLGNQAEKLRAGNYVYRNLADEVQDNLFSASTTR